MKKLITITIFSILFINCERKNINEELEEIVEIENTNDNLNNGVFEEDKIYDLKKDAWLIVSVPKAPARARLILEVYFENGTVEKSESNPNNYLSTSLKIKKDAIKAKLRVIDQDNLSGIKFSVLSELFDLDKKHNYFKLNKKEIRYFNQVILFK